jgi:hypothetical protein
MMCRLYQWRIERQIDNGRTEFSDGLRRHLSQCRSCRLYAKHLAVIDTRLSTQIPAPLPVDVIEPLAERVIRYLFTDHRPIEPFSCNSSGQIHHVKLFAGAMAAGLLIICSLLLLNVSQNRIKQQAMSPIALGAKVLQTPLPVLAEWSEKPMRTEVQKLIQSAENAVVFLWNCTPGHLNEEENDAEP